MNSHPVRKFANILHIIDSKDLDNDNDGIFDNLDSDFGNDGVQDGFQNDSSQCEIYRKGKK